MSGMCWLHGKNKICIQFRLKTLKERERLEKQDVTCEHIIKMDLK